MSLEGVRRFDAVIVKKKKKSWPSLGDIARAFTWIKLMYPAWPMSFCSLSMKVYFKTASDTILNFLKVWTYTRHLTKKVHLLPGHQLTDTWNNNFKSYTQKHDRCETLSLQSVFSAHEEFFWLAPMLGLVWLLEHQVQPLYHDLVISCRHETYQAFIHLYCKSIHVNGRRSIKREKCLFLCQNQIVHCNS